MDRPTRVVHNNYSPKETAELCSRAGVYKANMRLDKIFFSSFMAGCLLSFACAVSLICNSSPWYQDNAPGLIKMISAIIFPIGLVMVVLTGSDLCTGSFMYTTMAALHSRLSILLMLRHWAITFFGNLAGSLWVACIMTGYGGTFNDGAYKAEAIKFATAKSITPTWGMIFIRGIGANWLVCLACFLAFSAREYFSKVVAIWWPTFAFVCLGFDHVVANMFFMPMGIFQGTPGLSVGYYIWKSMIPALIGNIVGGGFFVGVVYWYLFLLGDTTPIVIDGEYFEFGNAPTLQSGVDSSPEPEKSSHPGKTAEQMV